MGATARQQQHESHGFRRSEKARFWQEHIEGYESSGLTIVKYCESAGINVHTFQYWRQKNLGRRRGNGGFVQVVSEVSASGVVARVRLSSKVEVECLRWPDVKWLRELSLLG